MKLWQKISAAIIAFIVILLFLTPRVAKRYIVKNSNTLIGRSVDIEKIRLNYFTGALKVYMLTMYENNSDSAFISFDKFKVNLDYWPLLKGEIFISEISIHNLYSQVIQENENFNFSDLAEKENPVDEEEIENDSIKKPIALTINNINLSGSSIKYTDLILKHTIALQDIDLFIPGFTWSSGSTNLDIDFDFSDGGGFYSNLLFDQADSSFTINLQLDSLNIDVIEPYIKNTLDISEINGSFSNNINIEGNIKHLSQLKISGWNKIDLLKVFDQQNRSVLSFNQLKVDIESFELEKNDIKLKEVSITKPLMLFELIDSTNNWSAMLVQNDTSSSPKAEGDSSAMDNESTFTYSLSKLEMQNGQIQFLDKTLSEEFDASIHNINIVSNNLSGSSKENNITLSATINQTGEVATNFTFNPTNLENMKANLNLQKFSMKDIEPYLKHYFGYPVEEGLLNFSTSNNLTTNTLSSKNKIYLRKFKLGKPNKKNAQMNLPLRLAVGILSDKDDLIDLDIPVESKGEETSINNMGKIIAKTIGNLFLKAATSPADILSALYKTDPGKLKEVKFGMFENLPEKKGMETLDIIAQILEDKPQLRIELIQTLNKEKYFDSLAYNKACSAYIEKNKSTFESISDSLLTNFLLKKLSDKKVYQNSNTLELCRQYSGIVYLKSSYDSAQYKQADFINDYLIQHKEISESRIKIINTSPDSLTLSSTHAVFHINFRSKASKNE